MFNVFIFFSAIEMPLIGGKKESFKYQTKEFDLFLHMLLKF